MTLDAVNMPSLETSGQPYAVLVERQDQGHWVAQALGWADCHAEGGSREIALESLQKIVSDRLARSEVVYLDLPIQKRTNPLMQYAGMFKDDPQFAEVLDEISAYRRALDTERGELAEFQPDG